MASCSFTHNGHTFTLSVVEQSYNVKTNTSVVKWTFSVADNGTWYDSYAKCTVNGSVVYNRTCGWDGGFPAQSGSTSGTLTVTHDANGAKSINFYLEGYAYSYSTQYRNGSLTLTTLDRAAPTVSIPSSSATSSSITFTINSDPTASQWAYQYKKTSDSSYGSWIYDNTSGTSRTLTISGLETNVSYSVYAAAKKSTNDVWGYATVFTITTPGASIITSAADVTLGESCSVTWTPLDATFKYKLTFSLGTSSPWTYTTDYISPNQTTSFTYTSYTIPIDGPAQKLTGSVTGQMSVTLTTYVGTSAMAETSSKQFTVTIPATVVPTISGVSIAPVAASGTYKWGSAYVKGKAKLKVTFTASGIYGSTISTREVRFGSIVLTGTSPITSAVLDTPGTYPITITITDSRGRTVVDTSQSFTVLDYFAPTGTITAAKNGATSLVTTVTWNIAPVNNGSSNLNTSSVVISRTNSGTTVTETVSSPGFNGTYDWVQNGLDSSLVYNYTLTITDKEGAVSYQKGISESPIAISRLGGGGGVTFFGEAQQKGLWVVEDGIYKEITRGNANIFYGACTDSASTVAKTVNCTEFTSENLKAGVVVLVNFTYSNTATSPTLNVNGTGAKPLYKYGTTVVGTNAAGSWTAKAVTMLTYNGTGWIINSGWDNNTTYSAMTQADADAGTATTARLITAKVLSDKILTSAEYLSLAVMLARDYSTTSPYEVGDFVKYSDNIYECNTDCTAGTWATNSSKFTLIGAA